MELDRSLMTAASAVFGPEKCVETKCITTEQLMQMSAIKQTVKGTCIHCVYNHLAGWFSRYFYIETMHFHVRYVTLL